MKPAIKIGMALEDDHPSQDNAFKAKEAPPRIEKCELLSSFPTFSMFLSDSF